VICEQRGASQKRGALSEWSAPAGAGALAATVAGRDAGICRRPCPRPSRALEVTRAPAGLIKTPSLG
jgi:hypothetical protein